ncbi:integral membrane sensor signal transduction histidine kinase [Sulfuricurvum kujiense DSM 16994]|uniref:histidine kinase n=1 Tax=Sulfuricurvum kujiense (strain ATCC BAA-921 / DSM 16994 / JCM 11577 / YK-1) TaxID=709032 RepID=E4TZJ9_SULKY|nr:HAMP domain-containing sensor histidine kinase [Sulfuricurvum kujiense]ADR33087.1 integral membrane sensor signal transduction histidine kinase [Sulfuricurvum kujiense DSM 16994]
MNYREKESFIKSFSLFFVALFSMGAIALWLYHEEQQRFYQLQLLTEMDAFSYVLQGEEFAYAIMNLDKDQPIHELIVKDTEVYALFPWVRNPDNEMVKVTYPHQEYLKYMDAESRKIWMLFLSLGFITVLLSAFFARYTLTPMRRSLLLMENFLKDIIHDLNTPVSSILLNSQLLKRKYTDEEIDRIYISGQTITGLYKNLEVLYRQLPIEQDEVRLDTFLHERIRYFQTLYPSLSLTLEGEREMSISINRDILMRIVDNLLSNACKYNRSNGQVTVRYDQTSIEIIDTGIGIKHLDKVFHRFYKETERGLGMGLHIVKTLADRVGIAIEIESQKGIGTHVTIHFLR